MLGRPAGPVGQQIFVEETGVFIVPDGVHAISAVAVGVGGIYGYQSGGAGGDLRWRNNILVTPGESLTITTSGPNPKYVSSKIVRTATGEVLLLAKGGSTADTSTPINLPNGIGGGNGGPQYDACGGGAGGYSGNGATGGGSNAPLGSGGGGSTNQYNYNGNYYGGGGGGVGLLGRGADGTIYAGGSGGVSGSQTTGGNYGGGAGGVPAGTAGSPSGKAGRGAARIIWGAGRAFPTTKTGNVTA